MITVEYKGRADRWAGTGDVHEVRAFWDSVRDDEGDVKRAASRTVRDEVGKGGSVTFESWDMDTYKSPSLAAIVRVRVLTDEQVARRKELKAARFTECHECGSKSPGEVVRRESGVEQALCFGCRSGLDEKYQVMHWIKKDGRIQIN